MYERQGFHQCLKLEVVVNARCLRIVMEDDNDIRLQLALVSVDSDWSWENSDKRLCIRLGFARQRSAGNNNRPPL